MAEVVLINPIAGEDAPPNPLKKVGIERFHIPMGLFSIATELSKENINVKFIDVFAYHQIGEDYIKKIKEELKDAIVVGFSVMTDCIKSSLKLTELIKKINPEIKIVWGGVHPTLYPKQCCEHPLIDYVVLYEGEETLTELTKRLQKKESITDIRGIAYKKEGQVIINPPCSFVDIENSPLPNWELLDMRLYLEAPYKRFFPEREKVKTISINSSRGCPHSCTFCINNILPRWQKWRMKSPKRVLQELEDAKNKFDMDFIIFRDENFFLDKKRAKEICEGIIERKLNIKWSTTVRASEFKETHLNENLLKLIKKSGCVYLKLGAESGSNRILELLKKDITVEDTENSAKILNKHNISAFYSFMIGLPGETKEDMKNTLKLVKTIKKLCPDATFNGPQVFRPYPGSTLYEECKKMGFKEPDKLDGWSISEEKDIDHVVGYGDVYSYNWIKNKDFVLFVNAYYSQFVVPSLIEILKKKGKRDFFIAIVEKLRWHTKFFKYLDLEYKINRWVLKIIK